MISILRKFDILNEEERFSNSVEQSISDNLSDIFSSLNSNKNKMLPFNFGIADIADLLNKSEKKYDQLEKKIKNIVRLFESRLYDVGVVVQCESEKETVLNILINGNYLLNGTKHHFSFHRDLDMFS